MTNRGIRLLVCAIATLGVGALGCAADSGPGSSTGTGGSTATGTGGASGSGGSGPTTGSGGSDPTGSGGATPTGSGGASGTGGTVVGGSGGAGPDAGGGSGGSSDNGGDIPPPHPLNVTADKMRITHNFRASAADPGVSFNDNNEIAAVDPRSPKMVGKLVMPFGGLGTVAGTLGNEGPFVLPRGFHVLGVAAYENYNILRCDADFFGDARRQVFDGVQHTTKYEFANIKMGVSDGVAKRTEMALKYLDKMYPKEDWGYFLTADGKVRWSDVIFTGISHGASNAPRFAMLVRASRSVAFAGPRDNSYMTTGGAADAACPQMVTATWLTEKPLTPIDRFYTLTGITDPQHPQHLFAMDKLGYVGANTNMSVGPPYANSHRITGPGGHESPCNETNYKALCNYLFGVDPANANGVP